MYQLYSIPGSCSTGIHVLLNKLALAVEIITRDAVEDYTALVPTNQVPALVDEGNILTEGAALVLHLLSKHHNDYQDDPEFRQWLMFNYATLHPAYSTLFTVNGAMGDGEEKQKLMQTLADKLAGLWHIIDTRLATHTFVYGESATVLDYLLAIYVRWGNVFPDVHLPVGENVVRLVKEVSVLPEFVAAFEREGITYSIPKNA